MMTVTAIWRYPVKSMGGERVGSTELTETGLVGDRVVQVYDRHGRVVTARTFPRLPRLHATLGIDREPLVDGLPWRSREVGELVEAAVGPGARVERFDGPERFDILPLLVCTDGAVSMFGRDVRRLRPNLIVGGVEDFLRSALTDTLVEPGAWTCMKELLDTRAMHASDPTDRSLLQRIAARDTAALAELYDRHGRLLFGLILRIVRDRGEAEDILQEAFVRVWTRAETYDAQVGGPLPWIVRVARNCAIDRLRARRVRATVDAPAIDFAAVVAAAPATDIQTPEAAVLMAEQRRTLSDALAGLPAEQRQLIEAAFFEGYTHSELAQRFGLPLGTVKTRIRAGMIAMRQRLEHAV